MGDIAEMHVEAYQAGLDPNEMDGADWADFYAESEPASLDTVVACLSGDCRTMLSWIDDLQGFEPEGHEWSADTETRAKVLCKRVLGFDLETAKQMINAIVALNTAALAEEDRLLKEESAQ